MLILFEDSRWRDLAPLTSWRCVWDLRCGIRTLLEKSLLDYPSAPVGLWGRPELAAVTAARGMPLNGPPETSAGSALLLNGRALLNKPVPIEGPDEAGAVGEQIAWLRLPAAEIAAGRVSPADLLSATGTERLLHDFAGRTVRADAAMIGRPWDLIANNPRQIEADIRRLPPGQRHSGASADPGAVLMNAPAIVIGRGARVKPTAVLDAEGGPIYIGRNATVSPHSYIQGPAAIGDGSLVQPGSVIRLGTSVGPVCKVGGEIEESILIGFANKQHDGFLGHSVLGEWCNLGAGTTNSDLKNTYGTIRVNWDGQDIETGRMFVGLTMGDHSKTAIGTRFTSGAMIGFACNILTSTICPKSVPDLTWLTDDGAAPMDVEKAIAIARKVMGRRGRELTPAEADVFRRVAAGAGAAR